MVDRNRSRENFQWLNIVNELAGAGRSAQSGSGSLRGLQMPDFQPQEGDSRGTRILAVERMTTKTVLVFWRDSGCLYGDQCWILGVAKGGGTCALTGQPIERGEAIFRPRKIDPPARNSGAMMLAKYVQQYCPQDVDMATTRRRKR